MEDIFSEPFVPQAKNTVILYIKYMVSLRCKLVVKNELKKSGFNCINIELGTAKILDKVSEAQRATLKTNLRKSGFELLDSDTSKLIEGLKKALSEMIFESEELPDDYKEFITKKIGHDYDEISDTFSEIMGITLLQYIALYKIEKVKELLVYDNLTLPQIAAKTKYTSVAQLYRQFKKITGLSPSFFKNLKKKRNENIKKVGNI